MVMKGRNNGKWRSLRTYLMIEAIALIAALVFLAAMFRVTRATVRTDIDSCTTWLTDTARETRQETVGENGTSVVKAADHWLGSESMREVRFMGIEDVRNFLYHLNYQVNQNWTHETKSDYMDCVSVAVVTDCVGEKKYSSKLWNGNMAIASYRVSEDEIIVWDLTQYFPNDQIQSLIASLWAYDYHAAYASQFQVTDLYVRETEEGLIPTRMRVWLSPLNGDWGYLEAVDFKETDTKIPLKKVAWEDVPEEEALEDGLHPNVRLIVVKQNEQLSKMLAEPRDWDSLEEDDDRYYLVKRIYDDDITYEINPETGIYNAIASDRGVMTYSESDGTYASMIAYYVLVDVKRIVWNKLGGTVVFTLALAQVVALIAMIVRNVLKRRRDEAEQLRNTFISAMAHELKAPVEATRETAQRLAAGVEPQERERCLETLTRESESMNFLLNRMLTYTRVADGKVKLQERETDLNELTKDILAEYREQLDAKRMKVRVEKNFSDKLTCDPDLMRIVIDNLISNAVRYGDEDSTIVIEIKDTQLSVWNQTQALSQRDLEGIWTPMYERYADGKLTTCGIGLAMCAGILKLHGATYGSYNDGLGLTTFFDFSKANRTKQFRRFAWINLVTAGVMVFVAYLWFLLFREQGGSLLYPEGSTVDFYKMGPAGFTRSKHLWILFTSLGFLGGGLFFTWMYARTAIPDLLRTKNPDKGSKDDASVL